MTGFYEQDPQEVRDYVQPLTGDTVSSASWTLSPSATLGAAVNTSASSKVRVSGLTLGKTYTLTAQITGASGQVYESSTVIKAVNQ